MSIAELFKRAPKVSTTVLVPFPKDDPEIVFEIARFAAVEQKKISLNALLQVRENGGGNADVAFSGGFTIATGERLKTAIKGWTWPKDPNGEAFSTAAAENLIDQMPFMSIQALVNAYYEAIAEDDEAAKKKATTGEASAPPSVNG